MPSRVSSFWIDEIMGDTASSVVRKAVAQISEHTVGVADFSEMWNSVWERSSGVMVTPGMHTCIESKNFLAVSALVIGSVESSMISLMSRVLLLVVGRPDAA